MTTAVAVGTPLAEALGHVIQPKLVEMGWSSEGGDDSALTEYVILMLVNGKTQEQIAGELSNDLLGLGEGDTQALDFSRWLFEQVDVLNRQINGGGAPSGDAHSIPTVAEQESGASQPWGDGGGQHVEMGDASMSDQIPTGPKAMRNGRGGRRGGMLNQINRSMDRTADSSLHRIRGQPGTGRINSHRDQRGNRFQNGGRRQMGGMGMQGNQMMNMNPQDQMHLMSLLEEQARMMAQIMPGFMPPAINPAFQQNGPQQGRSLFDRVERQGPRNFGNRGQQRNNGGDDMDITDQPKEEEQHDENNTNSPCRFNLRCTRADCPYAHQSPAAPPGAPIDPADHCTYGAACKNRKCTARHPSPAVKTAHQAEAMCKFFPNCANPNCHFKHPSMPLCRNGADCTTEGCEFTHLQTACKFNPCLNPTCPYKHAEGQRGSFGDKVWTADGQQKSHVSERKFVADENEEEELIKPGAGNEGSSQEIVT
ncbi:mRNA-binding protein NAB2 [Aspergillus chevalieri]|uniref:Nab2-like CCCH zinc finger domain-containing protein n=1 Tax=Aspergillus chevalieri TaxID=182096 RepID=A0A7R7VXT6_ASPCH|nr:uncharacterized protein ACHE_80641S [Aspergillus chevalieri]BCR92741.1 hypothetical protein ACHE_80641S [Aspergillus chevalieri]